MSTLIFDLETDGLYQECTKIHCGVVYDVERDEYTTYTPTTVHKITDQLKEATKIVAHNGIGFDIPVIKKLLGVDLYQYRRELADTLILSKLIYFDQVFENMHQVRLQHIKKLQNSHSLKAWGIRLGESKGDYGEQEDAWDTYNPEMLEYCKQDVKVTAELYKHLMAHEYMKDLPDKAILIEYNFARVIQEQTNKGWYFDVKKAQKLHVELYHEKEQIEAELEEVFKPIYFAGKIKEYKKGSYKRTCPVTLVKVEYYRHTPVTLTEFNPSSRQHIVKWLDRRYKWKPTRKTEKGSPIVDSSVLSTLDYPEAQLLCKYFDLQKVVGMLIEGKNGWLNLVNSDDRINGQLDTLGAVSGRCTHRTPNLAQVPSGRAFKGKECRELFTVPEGHVLIGCDASGLELRMLAHFLHKYDDGEYAKEVVNGDIHTTNQLAAGLDTRDQAKTFIYAFLYGAGDAKLGSIKGDKNKIKNGKELKKKFFEAIPAISMLLDRVQELVEKKGYLVGISGRRLHIRSSHSALNTLLQSAGAYVMKYYTVELFKNLRKYGNKVHFVGNIHDEVQLEVAKEIAEEVKQICESTFATVTDILQFKVPLEGEASIGRNWNETH